MVKRKTSITLSDAAIQLLDAIARKYAISRTAVLEIIIREKAKAEEIGIDSSTG